MGSPIRWAQLPHRGGSGLPSGPRPPPNEEETPAISPALPLGRSSVAAPSGPKLVHAQDLRHPTRNGGGADVAGDLARMDAGRPAAQAHGGEGATGSAQPSKRPG